ncbi:MAG: MBL fold metallo-hydrolase [Gammaproteobacteria bacterium]|nr:MBL fold metallo-hydrolase [Gammaproteobacteria bacterium]
MQIRQLFDADTSTYTYFLYDEKSKEAAIIDSVKEQFERDKAYVEQLGLNLKYALETHVHADHVTASGLLRQAFGAQVGVHESSRSACADILVQDGDKFVLGDQVIEAIHTPGHTDGDVTYKIEGALFTGDALLIRGCGRTDFQAGNPEQLYDSITKKLFTLADDTTVYPGHDYAGFTCSTIGEEKAFNPRLGNNKPKDDFVAIMNGLDLPNPRRIDVAIPGNMKCGLA